MPRGRVSGRGPRPLQIPGASLPVNPRDRHAFLRTYFCDKDAEAELHGDHWSLHLGWTADPERHIDPCLAEGLRWWGADLVSMPMIHRRKKRLQFSLYDTWTLYSWSKWLAGERRRQGCPVGRVVVLHVDDHQDMMSPRLFRSDEAWTDPITAERVDLYQPPTIHRAIESGSIGMGSFVTPFVHAVPQIEVRHLRQRTSTVDFAIIRTEEPDGLLQPGAQRPAIRLDPVRAGCWPRQHYRVTGNLQQWLEDLPPWPVLVHIDMDYFNNRFNGDSDWNEATDRLDPPLPVVLQLIQDLGEALARPTIAAAIADIAIAFVPGFFPAELWPASYGALQRALRSFDGNL